MSGIVFLFVIAAVWLALAILFFTKAINKLIYVSKAAEEKVVNFAKSVNGLWIKTLVFFTKSYFKWTFIGLLVIYLASVIAYCILK